MAPGGNDGREELWRRLEATALAYREPDGQPPPDSGEKTEDPTKAAKDRKRKRVVRVLDFVSFVLWPYAALKLLVVDLDRRLLEYVNEDWGRFVDYRGLVYLACLVLLVATVKRTWLYLLYVAFFPLVVLCWKLPRALHKRGSWLPVLGGVHALSGLVGSMRFHIISKGLAIIAFVGATVSHSEAVVIPCCIYLLALLVVVYGRSIQRVFARTRFLQQQDEFINWLFSKQPFDLHAAASNLGAKQLELYPKPELDKFTTALNARVILNRGLYYWAFQLEQYRQTPASLLINGLSYLGIFVGTSAVLLAVNLGIYHLDPQQFSYESEPSVLGMAVYSVGTLALNAGAGIEASGDWASLMRLGAGILGPTFLVTFLATILLSYRRERDDTALRETVGKLKRRAAEDEEDMKEALDVDVNEALRRLDRLGTNLAGTVVALIAKNLPDGFMGDAEQ